MAPHRQPASPTITADEALARIKAGNARFMAGEARFPTVQKEVLAELAKGQQPFATILGCSDSRVPPELLFDASFGELFVIRVAGNVLGPTVAGTLQYAGMHLHTPLLIVLGHEGCGAVQAAIETHLHGAEHGERIGFVLRNIIPALERVDPGKPPDELLADAVEGNVRRTLKIIVASPEWQLRAAEGQMKAVGAVYEIASGRVRWLD